MGSANPPNACKDVMLDIDSELHYWHDNYMQAAFHRTPRPFDEYLLTLKFGYDMYLLNHGHGLDEQLPIMRARYQETMDSHQCLDWPLAEAVIRETWKRMRPEINHQARDAGYAMLVSRLETGRSRPLLQPA